MVEFSVRGMTCGHCVRTVTEAVQEVDAAAKVEVDLPAKRVSIRSSVEAERLKRAIEEAGYRVEASPE